MVSLTHAISRSSSHRTSLDLATLRDPMRLYSADFSTKCVFTNQSEPTGGSPIHPWFPRFLAHPSTPALKSWYHSSATRTQRSQGSVFWRPFRNTSFAPSVKHTSMIKVEGLTKRYARNVAVKNISFEVGQGEIVGFLGKNGAGKTTTMRVLTCFLPPTSGTASVAGFDVLEQPLEVKKRIGYLPETPPLYPEMEVVSYLTFVARLKGIPNGDIARRVEEVSDRCAILGVKNSLIGKLSKGYRQRVGIAQALIHNPPVLILDEPTSGLDPEQQREARQLIASLSGDHTIILSTHILSEVEQSCSKVIIINDGRIVAVDSVANLHTRRRGAEKVLIEVAGAPPVEIRKRLELVTGVAHVVSHDGRPGTSAFEVEGLDGSSVRPDLARAVVQAGWNLTELRPVGESLEEIFLELTKSEATRPTQRRRTGSPMRNILTICGKELRSYFTSPIAYLLMALFGLIFGYFFYSATAYFVLAGIRAQMGGQAQPMSINDYVIAPLMGNASVVCLFLLPLISMRLFAEEKRSGTIELLMTSPVRDWEIILGKWLGAMVMYLCVLAMSGFSVCAPVCVGPARLAAHPDRLSRPHSAGWHCPRHRNLHFHHHQKPDHRGCGYLLGLPAPVGIELGKFL